MSILETSAITSGRGRLPACHRGLNANTGPAAGQAVAAYPYPSGTGDRASEAILRPVGYPKCPGDGL